MLFKVTFDKEIHILKSLNAKTLQDLKGMVPKVFKVFPENFYLTYIDEDGDEITLVSESDYGILLDSEVKSAKIMIREKSENFYDETQKIQLQEEHQDHKEIEALLEQESAINQASETCSNAAQDKSLNESIEEKLRAILPTIISQIKAEVQEEVLNQSKIMEEPKKEAPKVVHKGYTCDGCQMHDIAGIRYKCSVCNNYDLCEKCEATCDHPHAFLKIRHPRQAPVKIFVVLNDEEDSVEINGQRQPMNGLSELLENGLNFAQQFLNPNGQRFNFNSQQQTGMKEAPKQETEKSEAKQEKPEKKQETKKEEKMEVKVEQKVEVKPRETIPCLEEKKGQKQMKKDQEQRINENASYLVDVLDIKFTKAYKFAQKNFGLSKEELMELYFVENNS